MGPHLFTHLGWQPLAIGGGRPALYAFGGDLGPAVILVSILLVAAAFAIARHLAAERRRKELADYAAHRGLDFTPEPGAIYSDYMAFEPFDRGHSRRAKNLIRGRTGNVEWSMFDYRYVTGSGKNRRAHHYGIVSAKIPLLLPRLTIRPEGVFDKIAGAIGFDDIDFESDDFSRRYWVKASDRKAAFDVIHPRMIEYLLEVPARHWQIVGPTIVLARSGAYSTQELDTVAAMINGFVERLPDYLWTDRGIRPAPRDPRRGSDR